MIIAAASRSPRCRSPGGPGTLGVAREAAAAIGVIAGEDAIVNWARECVSMLIPPPKKPAEQPWMMTLAIVGSANSSTDMPPPVYSLPQLRITKLRNVGAESARPCRRR
jgi:hypothetical protein